MRPLLSIGLEQAIMMLSRTRLLRNSKSVLLIVTVFLCLLATHTLVSIKNLRAIIRDPRFVLNYLIAVLLILLKTVSAQIIDV